MPNRFAQIQYRFDTGIELGEQRAQFTKVVFLEFGLQRLLEFLLLRRFRRQTQGCQLLQPQCRTHLLHERRFQATHR
ncbi:hypothetical protein D3C86_1823010 [compost metagenome]